MLFTYRRVRVLRLFYLIIVVLFVYFVLIRGNILNYMVGGMRSTINGPTDATKYTPEDVAAMQGRINELEAQNLILGEENYLLRMKLDLDETAERYGMPYVLADSVKADVYYTDHGAIYRSVLLNRGAAHGVSINDPVVGPKGLIGRVDSLGEKFCHALLLTHPECRFGAYIRRTREIGLVAGDGNKVIMQHLGKQADVRPGDLILTSRDSGLTPAGILIGEVEQVEDLADEQWLVIILKTASDFSHLDSVIILKYGKSPK